MEPNNVKQSFIQKPWAQSLIGVVLVALCLGGVLYFKSATAYVAIDKSQISAPIINIGSEAEGILSQVYVRPGDTVSADEPVAQVGSETLKAKTAGLVIDVHNTPGQVFMPGSPVVSMIDPAELRVVGTIDEDKGLSRLAVGDPATFTVDAFGGAEFTGVVDEISPTSDSTGILFSISDKRPVQQFTVKVRYDISAHPEFKNGMSAKLKIYSK
jgi:multidrug resistance efflux pump